jgi:hypothetical protein
MNEVLGHTAIDDKFMLVISWVTSDGRLIKRDAAVESQKSESEMKKKLALMVADV